MSAENDVLTRVEENVSRALRMLLDSCEPLTEKEKCSLMWAAIGGPHADLFMRSCDLVRAAEMVAVRLTAARLKEGR